MNNPMAQTFMAALKKAECERDIEPLLRLFDDEAECSNPTVQRTVIGREQIREFWNGYIDSFRNITSRFIRALESPNFVALDWESQGVLASGKPMSYRGVTILETRNGLIRSFKTYYDSEAFSKARRKKALSSKRRSA